MPKSDIEDYDATASNNSDVGGNNIAEGNAPSTMNDAVRELMSHLKTYLATRAGDAATSATLDLSGSFGALVDITGTTTVTAVTLPDGAKRFARAVGAFQLTASASLIINDSSSVDYTTTAGDMLVFVGYASNVVRVWVIPAKVALSHKKSADIASATTTDLSTATGEYVDVTGTTTITGLGTADAGVVRTVQFDGALTLTHNATSLILPGAANIVTTAGDTATFVSEGSGNWRCVHYNYATKSWVKVASSTVTGSAVSEIVFDNLGSYRALRVNGFFLPSTDGTVIKLQASSDNGSTWLAGVQNDTVAHRASSSADTYDSDLGTTHIILSGLNTGIGNASGVEGAAITFHINEFNQARYTKLHGISEYRTTGAALISERFSGGILNAAAHDAIRFVAGSGNLAVDTTVNIEGLV